MPFLFRKVSSLFAIWTLAIICLIAFGLLLYGSRTDSAITDETAHIPAGYGYVHNFDFRLNPEHPPLVKAIAALPLLFIAPNFPTDSAAWTTDVNGQWDMGGKLLYGFPQNDANEIIRWARLGPILLTIFLIILIYFWSREFLGVWWGLLPTFLFGLSPTVLAHGHYVTTDIGAAFGVVLATYFFLKFLRLPSHRNLIYAGLAFGVAQITKFSTVLLAPCFAVILLFFYLAGIMRDWQITEVRVRLKRFRIRGFRYLRSVIIIFAIGYVIVVYPVYYLFTINYPLAKQAGDTAYILNSFAGGPTAAGTPCYAPHAMRCLADLNIWMSNHALTRPLAQYMIGILMVIQRSAGGNTNYFLGYVSKTGSRLYFPVVYLLKESLPSLAIVLFALIYSIWTVAKKATKKTAGVKGQLSIVKSCAGGYLENNFTQFSMFAFVAFYWAWSIKSPLNIGFRHLMPTLPFIYMLAAGVWKKWVAKIEFPESTTSIAATFAAGFQILRNAALKYILLALLLVWFFAETIFAAPYFLSYFNELGGGAAYGYHYVTDSNYDWGQDLLRLQKFVAAHPEIDKIAVDYFGGGNPEYYMPGKAAGWWSARGNPADSGIHWLAISINSLEGQTQPLVGDLTRKPEDEYRWLTALRPPAPGLGNVPQPDYRVGTSIFIYKL